MKKIFISFIVLLSLAGCKSNDSETEPGLSELARKIRSDFYLGSFASGLTSTDQETLKQLFAKEFNAITVGVYMKPTQPAPDSFNLKNVDDLVAFGKKNNMLIYFHTLIGGSQYTADWVNNGNFTVEELREIMRERITTILSRYRDDVHYVDVVNEAITNSFPNGSTNWSNRKHPWMKLGWHNNDTTKWPLYIEEAFRISREAGGPNLKLIYNDNRTGMFESAKTDGTFKLYKDFRDAGIPIDGIGMQFHCEVENGRLKERGGASVTIDFDSFKSNMRRFGEEGIELHITEFDVHLPENPTEADYELQAKCYRETLRCCLEEPACKSFKSWGFTDKYAWRPLKFDPHALMFDENYQPKRAYLEMRRMMEEMLNE